MRLYDKILNIVVVQRSIEMLIIPLRIWQISANNTRYLSAVVVHVQPELFLPAE